jgi:predicted DNA-binding ribbon-helix-helix protein
MRLEPEVWEALREICLREGIELRDLIRNAEQNAGEGGRTSAVRVFILQYFRSAATEDGHRNAGHGLSADSIGGVPQSASGEMPALPASLSVESPITLDRTEKTT